MTVHADPPLPFRIAWCRTVYDALKIGGVWGVPRSGLTFRKDEGEWLTLIQEDEREGEFPRQDWKDYQREDYEVIKENMEAAGIHVRRELESGVSH